MFVSEPRSDNLHRREHRREAIGIRLIWDEICSPGICNTDRAMSGEWRPEIRSTVYLWVPRS